MIREKNEIRLYYETHQKKVPEVARLFKIKPRTLRYWIQNEGWERGKAIANIPQAEVLQGQMIKREFGGILQAAHNRLKSQIVSNLSSYTRDIDEITLNNALDSSTDEILLQAMSLNYIQKNIALSTIIAKDELMRMLKMRNEEKPDPMLIAAAEKVAGLFAAMKDSLYGKDSKLNLESSENVNFDNMSEAELDSLLADLKNKEAKND